MFQELFNLAELLPAEGFLVFTTSLVFFKLLDHIKQLYCQLVLNAAWAWERKTDTPPNSKQPISVHRKLHCHLMLCATWTGKHEQHQLLKCSSVRVRVQVDA